MKAGTMITYTGFDRLTHGKEYKLKYDVTDEIVCVYTNGLFYKWINIDETNLLEGSNNTVAISKDLLVQVKQELETTLIDIGGCDHSVGICVCDLIGLIEDVDRVLDPEKWKEIDKDRQGFAID